MHKHDTRYQCKLVKEMADNETKLMHTSDLPSTSSSTSPERQPTHTPTLATATPEQQSTALQRSEPRQSLGQQRSSTVSVNAPDTETESHTPTDSVDDTPTQQQFRGLRLPFRATMSLMNSTPTSAPNKPLNNPTASSVPPASNRNDTANIKMDDLLQALRTLTTGHGASTRAPTFDPPKFSGNGEESLDQWIRDIDEYSICVKWTPTQKLASLPMLLRGRARQVFQDLPPEDKSTWTASMDKLQDVFGMDTSSDILMFQRLDRVQKSTETVREYAKDI